MEWGKLISTKRLGIDNRKVSDYDKRTTFESDKDRILFSSSFRRLSKKTQVHPFSKNDHVHTRLTHSLEVAQVGKSLGKTLATHIKDKLPYKISENDIGSIVQAACLAHDIGNPPFGHAGEEAISHWFKSGGIGDQLNHIKEDRVNDLKLFEGNAQGFRILTQLENHLFKGGLRLTFTTLATFLKYPWLSSAVQGNDKFGVFLSEQKIVEEIANTLGLIKKGNNKWCRHPLAFLSEAADDICYATIDLEDAVELKIIPYKQAEKLLLSIFDKEVCKELRNSLENVNSYRVNFSRLRGPVFDKLIKEAIESFLQNEYKIMNGELEENLFSVLPDDNPCRKLIAEAKKIGHENIYTETFKSEIELGCFSTLECLLEAFCKAAVERYNHIQNEKESVVSWKSNLVLRHLGNHAPTKKNHPPDQLWDKYLCIRRVIDYVSGMTDDYASRFSSQIRGILVR